MSQTTTPDGADHRDEVPVRRDTASEPCRVSGYLYGEHSTQLLPDGTELPATGKQVEVRGMELVRVREGKIVVDNMYYDNLAVAAQLGLLPQDDSATV